MKKQRKITSPNFRDIKKIKKDIVYENIICKKADEAEAFDQISLDGFSDDAVEDAEEDHEDLTDGVALGVEDQGGDPDEGGGKGEVAYAVEEEEEEEEAILH